MKLIPSFFVLALSVASFGSQAAAPLSGTAGNNLTAFNGSTGAMNNNTWNQLMNSRTPTADFGNCNALILRCAQPKCATGGCTSMDIAYPIVSGCVMANENCKGHGDALIQSIAAQIVANSTAKANQQASDAQAMANQAAAAQSAQQMQQMQSQLQQMQNQVAQQNAQTAAAVQSALDEQKQFAAAQAAEAAQAAAAKATAPAAQIATAVTQGVSADTLAREKASGQIMTQLENAEVALKDLKKTMQNVFDYAGCDASGNNCAGPKRARAFKQKAGQFFEPYETVLDEVYDALIMAQSLGVDITDIYMMLNGTCNVWGKYLCAEGQEMHYTNKNCNTDGKSIRTGAKCVVGQVIPMNDGGCQLIQMLTSNDEVQQNWLYPEQNVRDGVILSEVRVGCASEALDNSTLFRGRKKQASIDIETLQRMIEQDAPTVLGRDKTANPDAIRFCSVGEEGIYELQKYASLKTLPAKVCVSDKALNDPKTLVVNTSATSSASTGTNSAGLAFTDCSLSFTKNTDECKCRNSGGEWGYAGICNCRFGSSYNISTKECDFTPGKTTDENTRLIQTLVQAGTLKTPSLNMDITETQRSACTLYGGIWNGLESTCNCVGGKDFVKCSQMFYKYAK